MCAGHFPFLCCIVAYSRPGGPGAFGWFSPSISHLRQECWDYRCLHHIGLLQFGIQELNSCLQACPARVHLLSHHTGCLVLVSCYWGLVLTLAPAESSHWLLVLVFCCWGLVLTLAPVLTSSRDGLWSGSVSPINPFLSNLIVVTVCILDMGSISWAKRCILLITNPANGCQYS